MVREQVLLIVSPGLNLPPFCGCNVYNRGVQMSLRDFLADDFQRLWEIDQECFPTGISYSQVELMHYIRRHGAFTIVAEGEGQIIGFTVGECIRRRGHVITIDVLESYRRHGLGSRLMDAVEERFRRSGCEVSLLETAVNNMGAITFYKRRGYVVIKTIPRYYNRHLDALLMGRRLADSTTEAQRG